MQQPLLLLVGFRWPALLSRLRLLLVAVLSVGLGFLPAAQAQVDAYQFSAAQGTFTPLAGGTAMPGLLADTYLTPTAIPLGFPFVFDGTAFTSVKASSNGFLTFNATGTATFTTLAGASAVNRPLVAPLGDDLDGRPVGATAVASYQTTGTAPNRVFTFEWLNWEWRWNAELATMSVQVKLYEGTNRVEFVYRQEPNPTNATATLGASIGLAGVGTGAGSYLALSDSGPSPTASSATENTNINGKPATGQVYAFVPPAAAACPVPRNLTSTVQGSAVTLTWTVSGGSGPFSIEYGPTGFTPGSGTVVSSASPTATLTGLPAGTAYQFYVTQNCGGTAGNSVRSDPGTFTTTIVNDDPAGALTLPVNASCVPTNGTNENSSTTAPNGYANPGTAPNDCGIAASPKDVWYKFTTPASGAAATAVRVRVAGVPASQLRAFAAPSSAGPFTQIGCSATSPTIAAPPLDLTQLTPNTTYYIRVSGYGTGDATGAFTICVSNPPACGDPRTLTVSNLTQTSAQVNFVPGAGQQTFTVTALPSGGGTTVTTTGTTSPIQLTGLALGTTYTVTVRGTCLDGSFTATLTGTFQTNVLANDDPAGALALPVATTCVPTSTTNVGATTTAPNGYANPGTAPNDCGVAAAPNDVWYKFTTPASGAAATAVRVRVAGVPASQLRAFSAPSSAGPFTQIGCSAASAAVAAPPLVLTQLTPNTTYYIRVSGYGSGTATGAFTICVQGESDCPLPTGLTTGTTTASTASLSWSVASATPSGSFSVEYGPQGFTPGTGTTITSATPAVTLTGLNSNTQYCYYVSQNCGAGGSSQQVGPECFRTGLDVPANDEPCAATLLVVGAAPTAATNVGATTTVPNGYANPGCTPASSPKDVWFRFVAPSSGGAAAATVTGNPAGQVRLFSAAACGGAFTQLACQGSAAANTPAPPLALAGLTAGTTYYLSVAGFGSSDGQGPFTMQLVPVLSAGKGELPGGEVSVFPNPSHNGTLHLSIRGAGAAATAEVLLVNSLGQPVLAQAVAVRAGTAQQSLPVQHLAKGLYTLRLQVGQHLVTRKVVLE